MRLYACAFLLILSILQPCVGQGLLDNSPAALSRQDAGSNNIIAIVEDRVITREEVMREVAPFIPQIRSASHSEFEFNKRLNGYVNEIVQNMVDRELIVKDFKDKGMSIPESYLESNFEDYLKREFNGDRAELLKYLQSQGKTIKQFKEDQEKDIIVGYMQNQKRQSVAEISPQKIKEYYEANKNKWFSPASAHVSMITLKPSMYSSLEENKKLASDIADRARKGEDFAELAKKYSKDDSSAKGGDWGWYKKGELNPQLDKLVFALEKGGITDPVVIGDMIFILKLEDKKPEGVQSIDDVREQIEWTISDMNAKAANQKWLEGLRRKAFVKYFQ